MSRRAKIVFAVAALIIAGFLGVSCWQINQMCSEGPMGCVALPRSAAPPATSARPPAPRQLTIPQPDANGVVTVTAACHGVLADAIDIQPGWKIRFKVPTPEMPPHADANAFFNAIDGLARAMPDQDQHDRDMFYVHAHYHSLGDILTRYPKLDPALLREAKLEACRYALAGGAR